MRYITWIAGYPKSGTTWLRAFLSAYTVGHLDINRLDGFNLDDLNEVLYQTVLNKPIDKLQIAELIAVRGAALLAYLVTLEGRATIKTHSVFGDFNGFPLIPSIWTERAVQVVRDPRDIAVSMMHYLGSTLEHSVEALAKGSFQVKRPGLGSVLGAWSQHVQSWEKAPFPVLTIRYEDMADRDTWLKVVKFMQMEIHPKRIDRAHELTHFENLQETEKKDGFREMFGEGEFFRRGEAGAWRDELTPELAFKVEAEHAETMTRFGYEMSVKNRENRWPRAKRPGAGSKAPPTETAAS